MQQIAAYLTIASAGIALANQLHHHATQAKVALDVRRKKKDGFGFGVKR